MNVPDKIYLERCRLSLRKRQGIKFSHTEWETWVRVGCQFQARSHDSVFFFSCRTVVWVFFFLLLTPILLCCDVDRIVNKVLLHCLVADKWHSLCEKHFCFKCCHPGNEHRQNSQSSLGKWEQVRGIREPPSCLILYVIFFLAIKKGTPEAKQIERNFQKRNSTNGKKNGHYTKAIDFRNMFLSFQARLKTKRTFLCRVQIASLSALHPLTGVWVRTRT